MVLLQKEFRFNLLKIEQFSRKFLDMEKEASNLLFPKLINEMFRNKHNQSWLPIFILQRVL